MGYALKSSVHKIVEGQKLSIRHFYARLIVSSSTSARYRFTPDSITKSQWGTVEFDLQSFEYSLLESVPNPELLIWEEETACVCLGRKLAQHFAAGAKAPAKQLEWVS